MVQYQFAYDEDNCLINIKDAVRHTEYKCPYCKGIMIPKQGQKKDWHFAHKICKCGYDKYLHTISEIKIKEWYYNNEYVYLEYLTTRECPVQDTCFFKKDCSAKASVIYDKYNFKAVYPDCDIEYRYDKDDDYYMADLILHDNNRPSYPPMFIEIYVTHKCDEKKINSGIHIIELEIKSEDDLEKILVSNTISQKDEKVILYNFNPTPRYDNSIEETLNRTIIYKSGALYNKSLSCKEINQHNGIADITRCYVLNDSVTLSFNQHVSFRLICWLKKHYPSLKVDFLDTCKLSGKSKFNDEYICFGRNTNPKWKKCRGYDTSCRFYMRRSDDYPSIEHAAEQCEQLGYLQNTQIWVDEKFLSKNA